MGGSFSKELDIFKHVLHDAGHHLLEHRHKRMADAYIEEVERESSRIITSVLEERFPDYGMLNPWEQRNTRAGHPYVIFFDPLNDAELYKDGELFTVQATLMRHKHGLLRPVAAAVYDPTERELYTAVQGEGASMAHGSPRPYPLHVRPVDDIDLIVRHRESNKELSGIIAALSPDTAPQYMMSLLKIVSVAKGDATVYACPTNVHVHLAKICAPELILEEAGGRITTLAGRPFLYDRKALVNKEGILATNGIVHQKAIGLLDGKR